MFHFHKGDIRERAVHFFRYLVAVCLQFDKDNISERAVRLLKRIIDDPQFTPDQVAKQSKAAMSMCLWVRAMDTYAKVSKVSADAVPPGEHAEIQAAEPDCARTQLHMRTYTHVCT